MLNLKPKIRIHCGRCYAFTEYYTKVLNRRGQTVKSCRECIRDDDKVWPQAA